MYRLLFVHLAMIISLHAVNPVLIVDGRNNHDWKNTTASLKATLLASGKFTVDVASAPEDKLGPPPRKPQVEDAAYLDAKSKYEALAKSLRPEMDAAWAQWSVDFSKYKAVILNYNGPDWPKPMQQAFVDYVRGGGGVLLVHAANNAFADWQEFNEAIGLGWRKGGVGRCLVINQDGAVEECCQGDASGHGAKHPFVVTNRVPDHPILRGMPVEWMHAKDELYHHMRGPAQNVTILASAYSDESQRGTGRNEPVLWEVAFGRGHVLVCTMGHLWQGDLEMDSLHCTGFQSILARSAEYLSTGKVTLALPAATPTKVEPSIVEPAKVWTAGKSQDSAQFTPLTPLEQQRTMVIADGLVAECIASEPMVEQPVLTVWDGNGAMYVAEMRSYMQDEQGTGTKTLKNGRIKRLTDTNGDGIMDRATVFVDGLNLPRMILPLDDRIAVQETDDTSVWSYRDSNHDGVADEKVLLYQGVKGDGTKSVEHQPSGLDWNLDNYIYISYARERYRYTSGTWKAEPLHPIWSQWGITHDDVGRVYYSDNSTPAMGFEVGRQYWLQIKTRGKDGVREGEPIPLGLPWDMSFLAAKNLCATDDRGGKAPERKIFTSACGQSVYRGDALPEMRGDYFVCDPSIHVVRRAKLVRTNGQTKFLSAYGNEEFLLSPEIFFRPVNTATAPDGSLIVVDMYRGIIQDAPWLSPGPRKFIKESGLAEVNQRGRIWRIRKPDWKQPAAPSMLTQSTRQLVSLLAHANGWWRDTAQRLIILRSDRDSVVPALKEMSAAHRDLLGRLHALWTLEGIGAVDATILRQSMADLDFRVRCAATQISEPFIAKKDPGVIESITALASTETEGDVAKQMILSLGVSTDPAVIPLIDLLVKRHFTHAGVCQAACLTMWKNPSPFMKSIRDGGALESLADSALRAEVSARWSQGFAQWDRGLKFPPGMDPVIQRSIRTGEGIFYTTCVACHGADGKGSGVPGTDLYMAPALAGSERVKGTVEHLLPVFVNGLTGPIKGKTFQAGFMAPATALGIQRDDRLADVVNFIRFAWGNGAGAVTTEQVKAAKQRHGSRPGPWSDEELNALDTGKK